MEKYKWADVAFTNVCELGNNITDLRIYTTVDSNEFCKYKYLLNIAGWTSAYRLHMLTKCKSVIISMSPILDIVDLNLILGVHYYRILDENEIPDIMNYLLQNDEFAKNMAEKSYTVINTLITNQYLTNYIRNVTKQLNSYDYVV